MDLREHQASALSKLTAAKRAAFALIAIGSALCAGGCNTVEEPRISDKELAESAPDWSRNGTHSEAYRKGVQAFELTNFGLAVRYFSEAVQYAPLDGKAWIYLAASYDHVKRFDLADRAYVEAIAINGETVEILNNQGYSFMLRGDLGGARHKFLRALRMDPDNPTLINNLRRLDAGAARS